MSSFFTTPASQRKRKRDDSNTTPSTKRRNTSSKSNAKPQQEKPARPRRDESISSSGSEDEGKRKRASDDEVLSGSSSDEDDETGAERRLRLAEQYLQNLKNEVGDEVGFDAEEIDRDLIAERLQEDVAETKGRLYRHIASTLSFSTASKTQFRSPTLSMTGVATCAPYAYTVGRDIQLTKWELSSPAPSPSLPPRKNARPIRRRPIKLLSTRGTKSGTGNPKYENHTAPILCVAASDTGKFVATGGADKKLIIWSAADLKPLRVFTQHRDAVTSLAFRRGTNQLYSSSKDRTIKTWSLDELAYVETLFGHQDEVVDVAALSQERCISVGARDRTARLWKVVEETQLVFRGGGSSEKRRPKNADGVSGPKPYAEGSIDRIALIDSETFVTGSDNGSLALWSLSKKKPIFTVPMAHGLDPALKPEEVSAEAVPDISHVPERTPRWITALAAVPYSDVVVSGSWDGEIRVWKVSGDKKRLEAMGVVGRVEKLVDDVVEGGENENDRGELSVRGFVNDLSVFERGDRGKEGMCIVAAVGTEHRLGRWKTIEGKNGTVVFEVPKVQQVAELDENGDVREERADEIQSKI
ncbi:ribosomal RNA-processing protein 9, partial [Lecanoromycetidae sp. Uapishka_2]